MANAVEEALIARESLGEAVCRMDEKQLRVCLLTALEYSQAQIAEALGCDQATVSRVLASCRGVFAACMT
jgi:DNA-directed RNA polymerase specialized sigma24 family protein